MLVKFENKEVEVYDLSEAMEFAKTVNCFVTITDGSFEIVGKFGVDSIKDKVLPDGNTYEWKKRR